MCVWKVMVRSTLLRLDLRGALRAFLGGPPAVLLDDGFSIFLMVQSGSRNKSFTISRVSNYEEFDSVNDFSPGPRDVLS